MRQKEKLGNTRGVSEWRALASAADVKRYVRWVILSVRDQSLDSKTGMRMTAMGMHLLHAIELADLERELHQLEERGNGHARVDETRPTH